MWGMGDMAGGSSDVSRPFGSPVYRFGHPNSGAQIRFFQFVIQFNYLENALQRNLRTGTAREFIFRASGGTRFKNFRQPW